ncbi:MAG: polyprenol monophosphomannose synthase [Candidatus Cloacimonetes bacterium]|nr:polyprenol monophosphomannose synthase [Candidatus Cloacimonadota bacterium]
MKCLVIIPTYNESENIKQMIFEVFQQSASLDILVVDDNSPDETFKIVEEFIQEREKDIKNSPISLKSEDMIEHLSQNETQKLFLLKRDAKKGLGSAYVEGFKFAIERNYDFIIQMDADFSHDPKEIPNLLKEINQYDLVIGSRYIMGTNVVNWPLSRLILSTFASKYVQLITWMPIKDPTGGYKCIRISALKLIDLDRILSDGYSFQIEINYRIWLKNLLIKEIPIVFTDRRVGQSKMSKKIVREAVWMVWKLRIYSFFKKL